MSELKGGTKIDKESSLHTVEKEFKTNPELLDKANDYYDKLKPT